MYNWPHNSVIWVEASRTIKYRKKYKSLKIVAGRTFGNFKIIMLKLNEFRDEEIWNMFFHKKINFFNQLVIELNFNFAKLILIILFFSLK